MKKIFLLLTIFLLSACDIEYRISLNKDMSVTETLWVKEYKKVLNTKKLDPETYLEEQIKLYDNTNLTLSEYSRYEDKVYIGIKNTNKYNSLEDLFQNSEVLKNYDLSYRLSKNELGHDELVIIINNEFNEHFSGSDNVLAIKNIDFLIDVQFPVFNHNADRRYRNAYSWSMDYFGDFKRIEISFNIVKENKFQPYIIIIGGFAVTIVIAYVSSRIYKRKFS